jgi:SAM-dependent methyltransferase
MPLGRGARLADIGCSDGRLFEYLKERGRLDVACMGADFAVNPLKRCVERNPQARVVCADAASFFFKPGVFDAAAALQVIQHLPSREERLSALRHIHRALRENGRFVATVLNRSSWAGLVQNGVEGPLLSSPELFVHLYDPRELKEDAESAGFRVLDVVATNNLPVRYLRVLGRAGVWLDVWITRCCRSLSFRKGRYLLVVAEKSVQGSLCGQ